MCFFLLDKLVASLKWKASKLDHFRGIILKKLNGNIEVGLFVRATSIFNQFLNPD